MSSTPYARRDALTGSRLIDATDGFDVDNDLHDDPVLFGPAPAVREAGEHTGRMFPVP